MITQATQRNGIHAPSGFEYVSKNTQNWALIHGNKVPLEICKNTLSLRLGGTMIDIQQLKDSSIMFWPLPGYSKSPGGRRIPNGSAVNTKADIKHIKLVAIKTMLDSMTELERITSKGK